MFLPVLAAAQTQPRPSGDLRINIHTSGQTGAGHPPASVVWLTSLDGNTHPSSPAHFKVVQKNRMFSPRLMVIPVGSAVSFPNEDPFFHNVFSLFNGKRFDLGLYETGSSKEVVFSREGVSYIFCNIHPEMSAVIIALRTTLFGIADLSEKISMKNVPEGDYLLHIWVEGLTPAALEQLTRKIQVREEKSNVVILDATNATHQPAEHLNEYGQPYDRPPSQPY